MSGMWHSRNFWRLFLTFGLLILSAIVVLGTVLVNQVKDTFLKQVEDNLRSKAVILREAVREAKSDSKPGRAHFIAQALGAQAVALSGGPVAPTTQILVASRVAELDAFALDSEPSLRLLAEERQRTLFTYVALLDEDGQVIIDTEHVPEVQSEENYAAYREIDLARGRGIGFARRHDFFQHEKAYLALRVNVTPGVGHARNRVAFVRVGVRLDPIFEQLDEMRQIVWTTAAVTGAVALLLAIWLAQRTAKPLQELTRGADQISAGKLGHTVQAGGHDEVGTLARTFNRMSERLSTQFAQLEDDRQKLRAVLSSMVEGVVAVDDAGTVLFTNDRAGRLLGFDAAQVVGRRLADIVPHRVIHAIVGRVCLESEAYSQELTDTDAAGRSLTVQAARLTGPVIHGAVLVFHDTSELRRLERLRQEFVANVSHELKTPLAVIKACVETLLDGAADDPAYRDSFLQQVAEQAEHLHALIIDLLSLARVESGTQAFDFQPVDISEAVQACVERHRARAQSKQQTLEAVPPDQNDAGRATYPSHGVVVWADEEAVWQMLDNLVDNALKYTPEGGRVRVRWWVEDRKACLEVTDTGMGIPEADLPRVFERFYRVDKARSRELGGTGLGLAIVKHLAQAMHGGVTASSRQGDGSTFTVRLPLHAAATNAACAEQRNGHA